MLKFKGIPSVFMYVMNIQVDVIGLVLRENCRSKQVTDFIAWSSRCHDTHRQLYIVYIFPLKKVKMLIFVQTYDIKKYIKVKNLQQ
jgi:hypothetical protein